jgi:outer membrane lipopolysaccharide assembly protein LptE/RlpB
MTDMVWRDSREEVVEEVVWMISSLKCSVVAEAEEEAKSKNRELSHKPNKLK